MNGGTVSIADSSFVENAAFLHDGGAIWSSRPLIITRGSFMGNQITGGYPGTGGAVYSLDCSVSISYSTFSGNHVTTGGGAAIHLDCAVGNSTIAYSLFKDNVTTTDSQFIGAGLGGAIGVDNLAQNGSVLTIAGSRFNDNRAKYSGAIDARSIGLVVRTSSFKGNYAGYKGGAVFRASEGPSIFGLRIGNSTFYENRADCIGNAIAAGYYYDGEGTIHAGGSRVRNTTFVDNHLGTDNDSAVGTTGSLPINVYNSVLAETVPGDQSCFPEGRQYGNVSQSVFCTRHGGNDVRGDALVGPVVEPANALAYFPLLADSPAIGAGVASQCLSTDQLGNARPQPAGARCDSGSIEYTGERLVSSQQQQAEDTLAPTATESPTANGTDQLVQNSAQNVQGRAQWNGIQLEWDAPADPPDGFGLYRRHESQTDFVVVSLIFPAGDSDGRSYLDRFDVQTGTYYYYVENIDLDSTEDGERSDTITIEVDSADLITPTALPQLPTSMRTPRATAHLFTRWKPSTRIATASEVLAR